MSGAVTDEATRMSGAVTDEATRMSTAVTTGADDSILSAFGLDISIGGKSVCRALDLSVRPGEFWGVLGTNGVGKTTLLLSLIGLREPQAGVIRLLGRDMRELGRREIARKVGIMFQDAENGLPATVMQTALEGRHPHLDRFKWESVEDERLARAALEEMGIESLAARSTQTLSGGERRLLSAATLFTQDPLLMALDEPNSHLDLHQQIRMLDRVRHRVRRQGRAAIAILHDANLALRYCDRVLLLHGEGETESGEAAAMLTGERMSRLYRHRISRIDTAEGAVFIPV